MTILQGEAFLIVGAMLGLFIWSGLRHDLVAVLALTAAIACGVVPAGKAFQGFANPVVITIAAVLVLSRAVLKSGLIETAMSGLLRRFRSASAQIGMLTACVSFLSAFMKNVGALGVFMPIAIRTAEREERPASAYLMPLAFGSLIGGTITEIGTSPNLLISAVRQQVEGRSFSMFDFTPVGLPLTLIVILFLTVGWRLIPKGRKSPPSERPGLEIEDYLSEAEIPAGSLFVGRTVRAIEDMSDGAVAVTGLVRQGNRRYVPNGDWPLYQGDLLILQAAPLALKAFCQSGGLILTGAADRTSSIDADGEIQRWEAVILPESPMVGQTAFDLHLRHRFQITLLSVWRRGRRLEARLNRIRFLPGDVAALQGRREALEEAMMRLGLLAVGASDSRGPDRPVKPLAAIILAAVMGLVAFKLLPVDAAFFVGAAAVVLLRQLSLPEAYDAIDWPIVVMLGALIPVGEALKNTGAADLIAGGLGVIAIHLPAGFAVALMLVASMLITPFLHHAAAVIVMGPIAAVLAADLGCSPDPFLMAVALGASCDFLTPIGHQNNMLVMGPGGYRFGDYWRLGLPLSCLVVIIGSPLILIAWPLRSLHPG